MSNLFWFLIALAGVLDPADAATWPFSSSGGDSKNKHLEEQGENLVLVVGFPRSASLSIHDFFECNSVSSKHYCCGSGDPKVQFPCQQSGATCGSCVFHNLNASQPAFHGCGNARVFSQFDVETGDPFAWFLPQHFTLPLLHESYPKATFVLNTRETPERWADNVMHWYSVTNRFMNSFGLRYHKDIDPASITIAPKEDLNNQVLYRELEKSIARAKDVDEHNRRRNELADVYRKHTEKVRDFVRDHPSHRLVEVNVDDPDAGQVLAGEFSGENFRASCWSFDAVALDEDWKDFTLKV